VLQPGIKQMRFALEWLDLSQAMSAALSLGRMRMYQVDDVTEISVADSSMDLAMVGRGTWTIFGGFPEKLGEVAFKVSE